MTASYRKCSGVAGHGECGCTRVTCDRCSYEQDFADEVQARLASEHHVCRYRTDPWLTINNFIWMGPKELIPVRVKEALEELKEERDEHDREAAG